MNNKITHLYNWAVYLAGACLLLIPAFYNGYPLVNSDTSTFLSSGFKPDTPFDRPITYGLLLRGFSLNGLSMWFVVFIQALLMTWLITRTVKHVGIRRYRLSSILIITFLATCTSLSWIVSELIADAYTAIALPAMFVILTGKENKRTNALLYFIFFASVATHISHLAIFTLLPLILILVRRKLFDDAKYALKSLLVFIGLTLASIAIMGNAISKSGHAFLMAAMLDKGILKPFLDDNCATESYALCKHKNILPTDANIFLWETSSPLYAEGGWQAVKPEYTDINNRILSTPKYLSLFIGKSFEFSYRQMLTFNIGDGNTPFPENSNVPNTLKEYLPHEEASFLHAKQNTGSLLPYLNIPNRIIYAVVVGALILMVISVISLRKKITKETTLFLFMSFALIVINMVDCATFSQVNGRYGCKVMWLIPFMAILILCAGKTRTTPPAQSS